MLFLNVKQKLWHDILENNGWYILRTKKHHIYVHPTKKGLPIPVGKHPSEEVKKRYINQNFKNGWAQIGLLLRDKKNEEDLSSHRKRNRWAV
jgi:predicted RNA binding protein YcfA (HicA-like mRNA interferase family)